jgi:glycosyltransferase involved in cell wall biosynthesis
VIAGDGDDRPRLERKAQALGVGARIVFTGFTSEATLEELYRRSAALVLPSRGEGFGLVYLEAMRAGKPVVAARGSAAEEIVLDGETGRLVDPADREELAAALADLLSEPERATTLGAAGRERWRTEFSYDRYERRLHAALASTLGLAGNGEAAA